MNLTKLTTLVLSAATLATVIKIQKEHRAHMDMTQRVNDLTATINDNLAIMQSNIDTEMEQHSDAVQDLKNRIAAGDTTSPEFESAFARLESAASGIATAAQRVMAIVPDAEHTTTPPPPQETAADPVDGTIGEGEAPPHELPPSDVPPPQDGDIGPGEEPIVP